jgi:hypothetical protein
LILVAATVILFIKFDGGPVVLVSSTLYNTFAGETHFHDFS